MATQSVERFQTVIVGGGQAGLATGYYLAKRGESFVILDAGERIGDPWRSAGTRCSTRRPLRRASGMRYPGRRASPRRTRWPTTSSRTQRASSYPSARARPWTH